MDFEQSRYYVASILSAPLFDIEIADRADYEQKHKQIHKGDYPGAERFSRLSMKLAVFQKGTQTPDLFTIFGTNRNPYVSRRLAQAIIDHGLTGFSIAPVYSVQD